MTCSKLMNLMLLLLTMTSVRSSTNGHAQGAPSTSDRVTIDRETALACREAMDAERDLVVLRRDCREVRRERDELRDAASERGGEVDALPRSSPGALRATSEAGRSSGRGIGSGGSINNNISRCRTHDEERT